MTPFETAELLEQFASKVTQLPGVSRTNPHAFAEAKSELAGEMTALARKFRTVPRVPGQPGAIRPGLRIIGQRQIIVETRRKAG
ncbi:hypothetical protein [Beijerinckia sp. L45]|uniref:hypothetical protein n=1 Tax=Beijerinckia sp. L45 TaxID=1641855 RepID=UPI00131A7725|nr:hypothetical protein [Beijerinckia sp. L45]